MATRKTNRKAARRPAPNLKRSGRRVAGGARSEHDGRRQQR